MLVVVATDEEYKKFKPYFKRIIKTGVGYGNVFKALKDIKRTEKILNIGYAGSNNIPIGTICKVKHCLNYHPNTNFKEEVYCLNKDKNGYTCLTSNSFVEHTFIQTPVLFDMELYAIMSMGFKNVESIKIVSDNLSLNEYDKTTKNK